MILDENNYIEIGCRIIAIERKTSDDLDDINSGYVHIV